MTDPVTVWLLSRESVAKSPCKCGSLPGIYTLYYAQPRYWAVGFWLLDL